MKQSIEIKLANAFSRVLRDWLTKKQMAEVIKRNNSPEYKDCCATHDFCDPNQAMLDAFKKVLRRHFIFYNDEKPETEAKHEADNKLWDISWKMASDNNFEPIMPDRTMGRRQLNLL